VKPLKGKKLDKKISIANNAPADFPLGTTTVVWSVFGLNHQKLTATQKVTVIDSTTPTMQLPADIAIEVETLLPVAINIGTATATDIFPLTITNDAPFSYAIGTTLVTWIATDSSGNRSASVQRVTLILVDRTPPIVTPPADFTTEANGPLTMLMPGIASAIDAIDGPLPTTNNAPSMYPLGNTLVTWSAMDAAANIGQAIQQITVVDTTAPQVNAPANVLAEATGPLTQIDIGQATSFDLVDISPSIRNDAPQAFPLGTTLVAWQATDNSGNVGTAWQRVELRDTTPPTVVPPADLNVEATGAYTLVALGEASAIDVVDGVLVAVSDAPAAGFPIGNTSVNWSAQDRSGNSGSAAQTMVARDSALISRLPPDPGEAGMATLEGIDSDGDGVRDDVQRWIALSFPNSEKTRAALTQLTITEQQILVDADNADASVRNLLQMLDGLECLYYSSDSAGDIGRAHKAIFLNTYMRSKAWLKADSHMIGKMTPAVGLEFNKNTCHFDPDAMPN